MLTGNGSKPGAYMVTEANGTVGRTILNANGTYKDLNAKGKVVTIGKWSVRDGKTCFAPSTKGDHNMCFKESARAKDGSFTATPDKGKPVEVRPAK
jgi:protein involved in polysaccharide export with SLBB domain